MSDALNLIALAKMAVIVIGIFLVPVITRKFAADLGAPVGQMAMNRAAIAGAGLGLMGAKVAWASTQGARSAGAASILSPVGSRIRNVGSQLQKSDSGADSFYPQKSEPLSKKVGAKLENFGRYLEDASVRHEAKKAGVQPPSIADKIKKTLSADPQVTGPIAAKEHQYKSFVATRSSRSSSSTLGGGTQAARDFSSSGSFRPASPSFTSVASSSPHSVASSSAASVTARPASQNPGASLGPNTDRLSQPRNPQTPTSPPNAQTGLTARVQKATHRWRGKNRINRLFENPDERKPS
jgi:hypothetical protein